MEKEVPYDVMVQPYVSMYTSKYHSMVQRKYGISHFYEFTIEHESEKQIQAVPDGSVDLLFDIGQNNVRTYIGGTVLQAKNWPLTEGKTYFGVRFQPGKCILPKELAIQQIIDKDLEIDGNNFGDHLTEELQEQDSLRNRAHIFLKKYLVNQEEGFQQNDLTMLLENYIQRRIYESHGNISIKQLADETSYTECYIRRVFKKVHGISPKVFERFVRFQNLLKQMDVMGKSSEMEEMALSCGYYDQSHMIKDFKSFAGMTPEIYLQLLNNKKKNTGGL